MKQRSSLLSAFLVGLSLTYAGVAAADNPGADPSTNKFSGQRMVAQADQPLTQQAANDPGAGTSNAPSPSGTPSGTAAQPAVTTGTPVPGSSTTTDTPATAAAAPTARPKARPFAGSNLFLQQSMTTGTLFQGQTQYSNPTVESLAVLGPRYAINAAWQLRGRIALNYEWTNNDFNTYAREPVVSDTNLSLFYRKIPSFAGIQPALAINVGLPTSKASRARTLVATPGITAQFAKTFEHVLKGELMIIASTTYSHPLYTSRNPETAEKRPYPLQCTAGTGCGDMLSGAMNISDTIAYNLIIVQEWGNWSPALAYFGGSQWAYRPKDATNPVDGTVLARDPDATNLRQTHYFAAWLDYNFASWITGEVGYYNASSGIGVGGTRSNVIFDRYQDTRVYLGASLQLDNLVKALQGTSEGEGGVVRAKNNRTPVMTF